MNSWHGPPVTAKAGFALRAGVGFRILLDGVVVLSIRPILPGRRLPMTQDPRPATRDDLQAVETVVHAAYAHYVARLGRKPGPMLDDYGDQIERGLTHVIEHDGKVQGVLVLIPRAHDMLLDNVAVVPEAQGLGLGRGLLAFAERAAIKSGYRSISLYTNEAMIENISLYSRIGYVETHRAAHESPHF
jgi:ribosomal protein S18 acetylase RimI-like enzyme